MRIRACTLLACLAFALPVAAETVYKYRAADGKVTYSNRLQRGAELIETFEFNVPAASSPSPRSVSSPAEAEVDNRMKVRLSALDKAWSNVQGATKALENAEARLASGAAPLDNENTSLATAPAPVPPAAGGAAPGASPAVGGPMGTFRGGGRNAEYFQRQAVLEADVARARTKLDEALRDYNQLR